jgi:hypothetical protein
MSTPSRCFASLPACLAREFPVFGKGPFRRCYILAALTADVTRKLGIS